MVTVAMVNRERRLSEERCFQTRFPRNWEEAAALWTFIDSRPGEACLVSRAPQASELAFCKGSCDASLAQGIIWQPSPVPPTCICHIYFESCANCQVACQVRFYIVSPSYYHRLLGIRCTASFLLRSFVFRTT